MKDNNISKRHHYIPQFILRKFLNDNNLLNYIDINNKKVEQRNTKNLFMNIDMYSDEKNHNDDTAYIEKLLAKFEREFANDFFKILNEDRIVLKRKEVERIRIFLFLLSFRSAARKKQYEDDNFDYSTRSFLSNYTEDFKELWLKEVEELAKSRNIEDIANSEVLDEIIKLDTQHYLQSYYMTIAEARGAEFILTDIYPTCECFYLHENTKIYMHIFFPLSPTRILILNHIMFKNDSKDIFLDEMKNSSCITGDLLKIPMPTYVNGFAMDKDDYYLYKVVKVYAKDVEYINSLFLNEAKKGIVYRNKDKIKSSIEYYKKLSFSKRIYDPIELDD